MVILALVVCKSVSAKMMLLVMLNRVLAIVSLVGMEHTVRSHVQMVTGGHHVKRYAIVRKMALYVRRKMASVSVVQVTLANNAMNSVQRVRTVNNALNCVSVVKEVMDVIPSPVDVFVSLVIMVQCVIKVSDSQTEYMKTLTFLTECPPGKWGQNCQEHCDCRNGGTCDFATGVCRCTANWTGEKCELPCQDVSVLLSSVEHAYPEKEKQIY